MPLFGEGDSRIRSAEGAEGDQGVRRWPREGFALAGHRGTSALCCMALGNDRGRGGWGARPLGAYVDWLACHWGYNGPVSNGEARVRACAGRLGER